MFYYVLSYHLYTKGPDSNAAVIHHTAGAPGGHCCVCQRWSPRSHPWTRGHNQWCPFTARHESQGHQCPAEDGIKGSQKGGSRKEEWVASCVNVWGSFLYWCHSCHHYLSDSLKLRTLEIYQEVFHCHNGLRSHGNCGKGPISYLVRTKYLLPLMKVTFKDFTIYLNIYAHPCVSHIIFTPTIRNIFQCWNTTQFLTYDTLALDASLWFVHRKSLPT